MNDREIRQKIRELDALLLNAATERLADTILEQAASETMSREEKKQLIANQLRATFWSGYAKCEFNREKSIALEVTKNLAGRHERRRRSAR